MKEAEAQEKIKIQALQRKLDATVRAEEEKQEAEYALRHQQELDAIVAAKRQLDRAREQQDDR